MYRLNPYASKGVLLAIMMRYCGRWIITDGVLFDPKKMDALQAMLEPQNAADLAHYVSAVKQM
jgi:Zn-dependent metalloprotease